MNKWELMVGEIMRTTQGFERTQVENEVFIELAILKDCPVVGKKQHKVAII